MGTTYPASGSRRPVVVQHSFGDPGSGGPIGALERVLASNLTERYQFVRMHQDRTTGGIDVERLRDWISMLKDVKPDLVHVRGLGNEGFHGALAARLAGCRRILVSIHGTVRDLTGPRTLATRVIVGGLEPATLRMATHVTTVCEYASRRPFVMKHADKMVGPIPNGVPIGSGAEGQMSAERTSGRLELGLGDRLALVSVGRLARDKGHLDLAAALRMLPANVADSVVLVVIGDGPDRQMIEHAYNSSGVEIRMLGRRLDVSRLLAAADVFVFPSLHENLSNALLEAMSHQLAVVATRVGGNTEVLADGGGVLVEPGDPAALSAAITEVVTNQERRAAMGVAALSTVRERYSTDRMCAVLDEVYQRILRSV